MNKYDGGTLSADKLVKTLTDFLYNGVEHNVKLMLQLVEKLKQLREIIKRLDSFRLFSSSLLIMYDGGVSVVNGTEQLNGHTQSIHNSFQSEDDHDSLNATPDPLNATPDPLDTTPGPLIDIRMIDFGNATNSCFTTDLVKYDGPDEGYILGLSNIINVYEEFLKKL